MISDSDVKAILHAVETYLRAKGITPSSALHRGMQAYREAAKLLPAAEPPKYEPPAWLLANCDEVTAAHRRQQYIAALQVIEHEMLPRSAPAPTNDCAIPGCARQRLHPSADHFPPCSRCLAPWGTRCDHRDDF